MRPYFNSPLGVQFSTPLGVPKNILPAVISAIGGVAGQALTNYQNEQQNEDTRKWQQQMLSWSQQWQSAENLRAMSWQEKMWNLENAYNTPSAQRARLREAGFSPWQSGGGGAGISPNLAGNSGQGHSSSVASPSSPSPIPMHNPLGNLASVINDSLRADAETANQLSEAAQNSVNTAVALYERTGDFEAASRYLENSLKSIGGAHFSDDSLYFNMFNKAIFGKDLENTQRGLDIQYKELQNDIFAKYGAAEASAKVANLEQLTTKYVGELGLMSAQADKYRSDISRNESEIALNERKAYELGARAASEFAQAHLFGSEANINTGILNYVVGNARLSYFSNKMNYIDQYSNFIGDTGKRSYIVSQEGQDRRTWNYKQSPEGNYVSAFMKGFVDNSNTSFNFGGNYNYSRSFGNNRNYSNSWIWNGDNYYPHR